MFFKFGNFWFRYNFFWNGYGYWNSTRTSTCYSCWSGTTSFNFHENTHFHRFLIVPLLRCHPSKHFNFVLTLCFGWWDVATWGNVKSVGITAALYRFNVLNFNVDMNNVRQLSLKRTKNVISNRIHGIESFNYCFIIFNLLPMLRGICRKVLAKPRKFLKHYEKYCIATT